MSAKNILQTTNYKLPTNYGLLISFDGTDSSGKETQAKQLAKRLQSAGHTVRAFATPDYTTPSGRELKMRLQNKLGNWQETPWQEKLGYFANNRAEHREEVIAALNQGEVVIYDRYVPSSLAFIAVEAWLETGAAGRRDIQQAVAEAEYQQNSMPPENVSVFLDVPIKVATWLLEERKEILSDEDEYTDHVEIQKKLYREYALLCRNDPERFLHISCTRDGKLLAVSKISDLIWQGIARRFPQLKARNV
jgi:dTMP kinase